MTEIWAWSDLLLDVLFYKIGDVPTITEKKLFALWYNTKYMTGLSNLWPVTACDWRANTVRPVKLYTHVISCINEMQPNARAQAAMAAVAIRKFEPWHLLIIPKCSQYRIFKKLLCTYCNIFLFSFGYIIAIWQIHGY